MRDNLRRVEAYSLRSFGWPQGACWSHRRDIRDIRIPGQILCKQHCARKQQKEAGVRTGNEADP